MATPDRDTVYSNDGTTKRTVYTRDSSSSTGWFVGIIVALALLAIAYLVFSANTQPSTTTTTVNNTPAVTAPATPDTTTTPAVTPDTGTTAPMTTAPATPGTTSAPATETSTPATTDTTSSAPAVSAPASSL